MKSKKQSTINPILLTFAVVSFFYLSKCRCGRQQKNTRRTHSLRSLHYYYIFYLFISTQSIHLYIGLSSCCYPTHTKRVIYFKCYMFSSFIELVVFREPLMTEPTLNLYGTEFITCYTGHLSVTWIPWAKRRFIDLYRTKRKDKLLLFFSHSLTFQRHWCFLFPGTAWNCQKILLVDCCRPWIEWLSRSRLASSKPVLYLRFTKLLYEKTGRAKRLAKLENLVAIQQRRKYCSPFISAIQ